MTGTEARRVTVLGGTGWVGRFVCAAFAARGFDVLAVARNHAPHVADHGFRKFDLTTATAEDLVDLLSSARPDVVVNAVDGWDRSDEEMTRGNIDAVTELLKAASGLRPRPRVVHLGTIHEYGPVEAGVSVDESTPPRPAHVYARTKLAGSRAVLDAARSGAVEGVVLRLTNVCGPHPTPASFPGRLLGLAREAEAGRPAEISLADARRDFVDVRDVADAVVRAALAPAAAVSGRAFNIGSGVAAPLRDLVEELMRVAELADASLTRTARPVASVGGDWIQADVRAAERLLGWRPRVTVPDSLRAMWDAAAAPA